MSAVVFRYYPLYSAFSAVSCLFLNSLRVQMFLPANSNHLAVFTSLLGLHPTPEAGPGEVHPDVLGHVLQAIHV